MEEIPHLALKVAKKLNPKAQCWRWAEGFWHNGRCTNEGWGCWVPTNPQWLPHCIYAVTSSEKERPSWVPTAEQLKTSERLKKSFESGKKLISQPETSLSSR